MKFALLFSVSAMLIRLALFFTETSLANLNKHILLLHMLFILVAVVLNIFFGKTGAKSSDSLVLQNIQKGLAAAIPYAVLTAIFAALYFNYIDPEGFFGRRQDLIDTQIANAPEGADIEAFANKIKDSFTIFNYTTITLIGLMLAGVLYSVIAGALMHIVGKRLSTK